MVERHVFPTFEWIDFTDSSVKEIEQETVHLQIEANWIEDSLERGHLPKFEQNEQALFFIFRAHSEELTRKESSVDGISSKMAIYLHGTTLLTIHRAPFPFLTDLRPKVTHAEEWMIYLMGQIILSYEGPIESQFDQLDQLENKIFLQKTDTIPLETLYLQKNRARISRRILLLTQHVLHQWEPSDAYKTQYQDLKDSLVDHLLQYDEIIDSSQSLLQTSISLSGQRNNDVMKLLTVFSVFFLPLTFLVGALGLKINYMPELRYRYGYPLVWAVMGLSSLVIFLWFKRKNIV